MNTTPTPTTVPAPHISAGLGVPPIVPIAPTVPDEEPRYRHIGNQRFVPANDAAREEVRRWNDYATRIMARSLSQ